MYRNVKNIVWIFSLISIVFAQRDFDEELKYKNESIETLKKEIVDLQKKIKKMSSREKSATKKITTPFRCYVNLLGQAIAPGKTA